MQKYQNIVIGGGPAGITMAYLLKHHGKTLLIEKEDSLGGCHRVIRVDGHFTEHSPRVYLGNYLNWQQLLTSMGLDHDDYFQRYKFGPGSGINLILQTLDISEILQFAYAFGQLMINSYFGKDISVDEYFNLSPKSRDVIDRMCRLSDGSDITSCNLWGFLNLLNMNVFYSIYQPKDALDKKLWPDIQSRLPCEFAFNTQITKINRQGGNQEGNQESIYHVYDSNGNIYSTNRVFLAIPPTALSRIFSQYQVFAKQTEYLPYIQMTLSWKDNITIPLDWGSVIGPWGLIWIPLTNYFSPTEGYKTVLSISISKQHSNGINGYMACTATKDQLIKEVLDTLNVSVPDSAILNPRLYHDNNLWKTHDVAYVKKPKMPALSAKIDDNMYTIGWHNDNGTLAFATLENAVVSAKVLANELGLNNNQIDTPITLRFIILTLIILTVLLICVVYSNKLIVGISMIVTRAVNIFKSSFGMFTP